MTAVTERMGAGAFLALPERRGAELVDGKLVVTDPSFEHQRVVLRILSRLVQWVGAGDGRGEAGFGGNWTLAPDTVLKPDAWWCREERRPPLDAIWSADPPDLVVEVRSPGTWAVDIGPKLHVYEAAGVLEVWLLDTTARTVLVQRRSHPDQPASDQHLDIQTGAHLTSPLLEGFDLAVDDLFIA